MASFGSALETLNKYAPAIIEKSPGVHAVGVGAKDGIPIGAAKGNDFTVTALVSTKMPLKLLEGV